MPTLSRLHAAATLSAVSPTETPLHPLCPACGAERIRLGCETRVCVEVVAPQPLGELQVVAVRLEDDGWDDADTATCVCCGWQGTAAELRRVP